MAKTDDRITVNQSPVSAGDIAARIDRVFVRHAKLSDGTIDVTAVGGHVTLWGTVATWDEYEMAEEIAWMSPGVTSVTNEIAVLFP